LTNGNFRATLPHDRRQSHPVFSRTRRSPLSGNAPPKPSNSGFFFDFPLSAINLFLFTLLRTLLHCTKSQLVSFHILPHSLRKTPGVGVTSFMPRAYPVLPWPSSLATRLPRPSRGHMPIPPLGATLTKKPGGGGRRIWHGADSKTALRRADI
jgi:hypothetical protein